MKKFIALTLATIGVATSARAQWVVYDPAVHTQQILDEAQNIAKYIEMINNQVQQIRTLTDQLSEFKHYENLFGDPKAVLLSTAKPLTDDLRKTELGQTLTTLESSVNSAEAMRYNAGGLFQRVGTTFKTPREDNVLRQLAGLPQTASERAFDMFLKVRHVQSLNGGGGVVFATGTPIANSMAEMFTMQRYLQPGDLKKHNLHHFDSWAATFGEPVTAMELSPDGAGYRLNTRFARFINVPELMQMFRQAADVQTAAMLNLPRPRLDGEKPAIRNAPVTPELKAFVQELAARAERLKTGRVNPSEDNMLKITSEGRKAALDLRLMKPTTRDEPQGKVNQAVENIHRIWQAATVERSAQMVFCDLSTPKDRGFSVYRDVAEKLERLGVPGGDIAFIQDYDSDASKLALFRDVRAGKVRILFGSTQKMGSGTNVQERLIALHHLDAPWRPADVEQREGRILRQGNKNSVVQIYRYVSEGSFDAYMWVRHEVAFVIVRYETTIRRTCGSVRSSLTAPARGATLGSEAAATTALRPRTGNHPRGRFRDCQRQRGLRVRLDDMPKATAGSPNIRVR